MPVFTIGHSTRRLDRVIELLHGANVDLLVDVRRFPHSRRQTQFNIETFPDALQSAQIGYKHVPALGGRRKGLGKDSPHQLWREEGFRNYADYAETSAFQVAFQGLLKLEKSHRLAIMCAEAVWWQCHRRIISDYLLAAGIDVQHILENKIEPARLTPGAIIRPDHTLLYSDTPLL